MMLEPVQYLLGIFSGILVGFTLGVVGGGGSILAVPLMVYLVGVRDAHLAIGTSAFAVAVNAAFGLVGHARAGTVNWRCGGMYSAAGIAGALVGSTAGKAFNATRLLFLFALVLVAVGILMLRARKMHDVADAQCDRRNAPKVMRYGLATGLFSGFFGIGGGFLIVPGLVGSTKMPMLTAVGTSLLAVMAFGITTAFNYAIAGLIDWQLASIFIGGGVLGELAGAAVTRRVLGVQGRLTIAFAVLMFIVAGYMMWKSGAAL